MMLSNVIVTSALLLLLAPIVFVARRRLLDRRLRRVLQLRVARGLPAAGTLLEIAVAAGLSPREALAEVVDARRSSAAVGAVLDQLDLVTERLALGADFDAATMWFADSYGSSTELIRLLDVLRRAEHDGGALTLHLGLLVHDLRRSRAVVLDVAAQRLTVSLLGPLVLCILPAFVLLAIVPLLLDAFAGLPG